MRIQQEQRGGVRAPANEEQWVGCDSCGKWRLLHLPAQEWKALQRQIQSDDQGVHWYCGNRRFDPDPAQCAIDGGGENGGDKWDADAWTDWNAGGDPPPAAPEPPPAPAPPPPPAPPAPPAPAPLMLKIGRRA